MFSAVFTIFLVLQIRIFLFILYYTSLTLVSISFLTNFDVCYTNAVGFSILLLCVLLF
jgi:hypothetical protein